MFYDFETDNPKRAKAALILYAIYRSRGKNSSLNGVDTWNRFTSYIRGACLKSTNTAEFASHFAKMAGTDSIKPCYLKGSDGLVLQPDGSLIVSENVKDYKIGVFEDDDLLPILERESVLLTMLVRERIQREKNINSEENEDEEDQD